MLALRMARRDGRVVEQAKPHRARRLGMMPRRPRGNERVVRAARHYFVDREHGPAGGPQRRLIAAGRHRSICVEVHEPGLRHRIANFGDVLHGMAPRDLLKLGARRLRAREMLKALMLEDALDRAQAIRPLGMPGRVHMLQARPMRDERRRHTQRSPVTTTPGGGRGSSGTKNVGASGWLGSMRYGPKSLTPSEYRKLSSIRKCPEKLFAGFWKMWYAASAIISGERDIPITRSPPSRFFMA